MNDTSERTCGCCSFYERLKTATPCNGCNQWSAWTPKPDPQDAPTEETPRCPHLQCAIDTYWNDEYGQELLKNKRILAAIRDDKLAKSVVCDYATETFGSVAIGAYRAALLERITKESNNG